MNARKIHSILWLYYDICPNDESLAECLICGEFYSRGKVTGHYNTTNLRDHLQHKHPKLFTKLNECEHLYSNKRTFNEMQAGIATFCQGFNNTNIKTSKPDNEITNLIKKMLIVDLMPFCTVEKEGFKSLLAYLAPNYVIPSRSTFSKSLLPSMYKEISQNIFNLLTNAYAISISTDIWTSRAQDSFIVVNGSFVDMKFNKSKVLLDFIPFNQSHTGINILNELTSCFERWRIENLSLSIVSDNGANFKYALNNSKYESFFCFLHTLHLLIIDSVFSYDDIEKCLSKFRKLVTHFKKSVVCKERLMSKCDLKPLQDVPHRWGSTYVMVDRLVNIEKHIKLVLDELEIENEISSNDWHILKILRDDLEYFDEIRLKISSDQSSISDVIPMIVLLNNHFQKRLETSKDNFKLMYNNILKEIHNRFDNILYDENYLTATMIDPRYKQYYFNNILLQKAKKTLKKKLEEITEEECERLKMENITEINNEQQLENDELFKKSVKKFSGLSIENEMEMLVKEKESETNLVKEIDLYLNEELLKQGSVLAYWKKKISRYPKFAIVALKMLSISPSSIESERIFSMSGVICNMKRTSLSPENLKLLCFLKYFLDKTD